MVISGIILMITLVVFAVGKSPLFRVDRAGVAIIGAALTVASGVLSFDQAARAIDYRTMVLLFSMMIVTASLKASGFFRLVGNYILKKIKTGKGLLFGIIMTSGLLSAFFINDIVCLLFTPIVLLICRERGISPIPFLIGVATASNVGSAGTLLGNPQNILIGSISKIPFLTYFTIAFPLALVGLLLNYFVLAWVYRDHLRIELASGGLLKKASHNYLIGKSLIVTLLILGGFLLGREPAVIASLGAACLLVTRRLKPNKIYENIDFNLLVMFGGLFVIMGGVEHSGLMNRIMEVVGVGSFSAFSVVTVVLSNVFSNVPAVMLLKAYIPVNEATVWWTGLGVFSTFAGNLTVTGSIANLIVIETAKRDGVIISYREYLRVGIPLTVLLTGLGLTYFAFL